MQRFKPLTAIILAAAFLAAPIVTFAGTQDFTLVNQTGFVIYEVYVSETANEDWEEDVLGRDVLDNGSRLDITFSGRKACLWDIMVVDKKDNTVEWTGINLCEVSVVVLRCKGDECWADYE